jgi:hypothetical protein
VDLTELSVYAFTDPEPEFVDINARNQAVVTLQENNHVVVVNLRKGSAATGRIEPSAVKLWLKPFSLPTNPRRLPGRKFVNRGTGKSNDELIEKR